MESFRVEERPGWIRICPYCNQPIKFTKLVAWSSPNVFFYSESGNDVLLRQSDSEKLQAVRSKSTVSLHDLEKTWVALLETAPAPPSGGRFTPWANIKCPHCRTEFPYNKGVRDLQARLQDPYVVLIDGATIIGDTLEESWKVKVIAAG